MIKITKVALPYLSNDDYRKCESLNHRDRGTMRSALSEYRCDPRATVVLAKENDQLLGWSLSFYHTDKQRYPECHFYVRKAYRKRGIGKRLMVETLKNNYKIRVHPHDMRSGFFFAEFRTSIYSPRVNWYMSEAEKLKKSS